MKRSPDHECPAADLDMTTFMEHLSDEYICRKAEVSHDGVPTNPSNPCKTKACTDLGQISSVSRMGFERKEKVRWFNMKFCVFCHETFW